MTSMTIEEARKILGKGGDELSDEQLEHMISTMEIIARETVRAHMRGESRIPLSDGESRGGLGSE